MKDKFAVLAAIRKMSIKLSLVDDNLSDFKKAVMEESNSVDTDWHDLCIVWRELEQACYDVSTLVNEK